MQEILEPKPRVRRAMARSLPAAPPKKHDRRGVIIFLLAVALTACCAVIILGAVRYRVPRAIWSRIHRATTPIVPAIPLSLEYAHVESNPPLSFARFTASREGSVRLWQRTARAKLLELSRASLTPVIPTVRHVRSEDTGRVMRETLVFAAVDGMEVPAFLLRPETSEARAGLLVVPGHSRGIVATAGIIPDYQHGNALHLAQAGYVVLTMEIRGMGYLAEMGSPPNNIELGTHVAYSLQRGAPALGLTISDLNLGLNYLRSREDVAPDRIGVVGFSSGGKAAVYFAALDERVRVVVASGCVVSNDSSLRYSRHDTYGVLPDLASWLEMSDCLGLISPRPLLVHWGALDTERKKRSAGFNPTALPTFEAARAIYAADGHAAMIEKVVTPGLKHEFDNEAALAFLLRHLPPTSPPS